MRIAVMGAGGVGGYFGGRLAEAGEEVVFIARGAHLEALGQQGLRIDSALGDVAIHPIGHAADPAEVGVVDMVIFAVKLYDTEAAAAALRPLLGPTTGVVTLQNGIDGMAVLTRVLGAAHVIGGVAQIAAVIAAPGMIQHTGTMARVTFGETDGAHSARVEALATAFGRAGVEYEVSAEIERAIWEKMAFLSAFSGMTALMRLPIGPIREDRQARGLLQHAVAEAAAVAKASGTDLGADFTARRLGHIDQLPASMKSSLLQDLERGRRLELPWLSGAISRMGRDRGVATPTHDFITTALSLHVGGRT